MKLTIIKALILFTLFNNLYASSLNLNWTINLSDYLNTSDFETKAKGLRGSIMIIGPLL